MQTEQPGQGARRPDDRNGADGPGNPKEAVSSAANKTREAVESQVDDQRSRMAGTARHAANAAHDAAQSLRGSDPWMASLVEKGADGLADLAETLRRNDLKELLSRAQEFARNQPVLFTGAAAALGFVLSRAAKAAASTQAEPNSGRRIDSYTVEEGGLEH
jgi:ElaB/YqjD/DUF883 family membrane-anchored ribosome-binding protein